MLVIEEERKGAEEDYGEKIDKWVILNQKYSSTSLISLAYQYSRLAAKMNYQTNPARVGMSQLVLDEY